MRKNNFTLLSFILFYLIHLNLSAIEFDWNSINKGLVNINIRSLLVVESNIYVGTTSGIFVSKDLGNNWIQEKNGLQKLRIQTMVQVEKNIFIGTREKGIYVSTDKGLNWIAKNNGITSNDIRTILFAASRMIIGTSKGIYVSTDYGDSWNQRKNQIQNCIIEFLFQYKNTLFAATSCGLFRSTDGGDNWLKINIAVKENHFLVLYETGDKIYTGSTEGIFVSQDLGNTWSKMGESLNSPIYSIALQGEKIIIGTEKGIFFSNISDLKWGQSLLTNSIVYALVVINKNIYAGTFGSGIFASRIRDDSDSFYFFSDSKKVTILTDVLKKKNINTVKISYNGDSIIPFKNGNFTSNDLSIFEVLIKYWYLFLIVLSIPLLFFRYPKNNFLYKFISKLKQSTILKQENVDEDLKVLENYYDRIMCKKDLLSLIKKISHKNPEEQITFIAKIKDYDLRKGIDPNELVTQLNKITTQINEFNESLGTVEKKINDTSSLLKSEIDIYKEKSISAESKIAEYEVLLNNEKKKMEKFCFIGSLTNYARNHHYLAETIIKQYYSSLKIIDDLKFKDLKCYEIALKIIGKLNFSINISHIGLLLNIYEVIDHYGILVDEIIAKNSQNLSEEEKMRYITKHYFKNFWEKHLSAFLIYFEELRNMQYFLGKKNEATENLKNIFREVIESYLYVVKDLTGFEIEYIPIFQNRNEYLGRFEAIDEEVHHLYKSISTERNTIIEVKNYGFKKSDEFVMNKTRVVLN